uniref:Secreted protein n=1 Tax=Anopheles atroparvus TaxID=41427 RepID=A0AAG5D0C6_ANOAO
MVCPCLSSTYFTLVLGTTLLRASSFRSRITIPPVCCTLRLASQRPWIETLGRTCLVNFGSKEQSMGCSSSIFSSFWFRLMSSLSIGSTASFVLGTSSSIALLISSRTSVGLSTSVGVAFC